MAEENTVTRTVENVDRLFSEIIVNGESHVSERYVAPEPETAPAVTPEPEVSEPSSDTPSQQSVQGQDVYAVELNDVLHNFVDRAVTQGLANEVSTRENADNTLQGNITMEATARQNADNTLQGNIDALARRVTTNEGDISDIKGDVSDIKGDIVLVKADISDIEALIPNQASDQNQLADKEFVNSSISTNTANFLGTYTTLADIEAIQNPTNNDYAFLQTTDSAGNTQFDRYKYSSADSQWHYEYTLNNSSFTAEQWATINSGLTQNSVDTSIENAINALDVASSGGSGKYISAIEQIDGKISATEGTIDSAPTSGSDNPVSSDGVYQALQNAGGSAKYVTSASTTSPVVITNAPAISTGDTVKIWFYNSVSASNGTTGMVITYNGTNYPVKVDKGGTLADFTAWAGNGTNYFYFTANKVIDFLFNGTSFIIEGLPVVQSSAGSSFARLADGFIAPSLTNMNNQLSLKLGKLSSGTINPSSRIYIPISSAGAYLVSAVGDSNSGVGALFIPYIGGAFYWSDLGSYGNFPLNVSYSSANGIEINNNNYYNSVIYSVIKLT